MRTWTRAVLRYELRTKQMRNTARAWFPDRGAKKRGSAASLDWSTESAGLRHLGATVVAAGRSAEDDVKPARSCSRRAKSPAPLRPSRNCRCVAACWITWSGGPRDLLPMGQHTAQDLSHRPLQSRPHMGGRDSGGGLRTTVSCRTAEARRGRHDLHGQFATPAPVVSCEPRACNAGKLGSARCAASVNNGVRADARSCAGPPET